MANPTQLGAAAAAPAPVRAAAAAGHPMEEFVFGVGRCTLLLSAAAMIYALSGGPPQVSPSHLILLFLLCALGFCLIHVSAALRGLPRGAARAVVATARALHRLFWEQQQ